MITDIRRQLLINELIIRCFENDNEKQNLLRVALEQIDPELSIKIGKTWFYNMIAEICEHSPRTAFTRVNGVTPWTIADIGKIKQYFNNSISIDTIVNYLNDIKELTKNEK